MKIYAIRDSATNQFGLPFFENSDQAAIRSVKRAVNTPDQNSHLNTSPGDYELYYIGEFNQDTGVMVGAEMPAPIERCIDLVVKEGA